MSAQLYPPTGSASRTSRSMNNSRSMSTNVRRLHEALGSILTETERGYFVKALNDYHSRRNVQQLVQNLAPLLDTAEKKQLYMLLRKVIPSTDQAAFWQYAQSSLNIKFQSDRHPQTYNHGHGPRHPTETLPVRTAPVTPQNQFAPTDRGVISYNSRTPEPYSKTAKIVTAPPRTSLEQRHDVRRIVLQKEGGVSLGFSIRGGSEHSVGIFVTQVQPGGYAESQGLMAGDQLVAVNDIPFDGMSHAEAVMVLKAARNLVLYVKSVGRVPGSFQSQQTYTWVDPQGRSVSPPPDADPSLLQQAPRNGRKQNPAKNAKEKKVTLVVADGESLGLMIRGGREFGLGIYVTGVDPSSVAEHCGLKVGDQIIDVNNQTFQSIEHRDAVSILKSSKVMVMIIRDVKKLPYARTTVDRTQWLTGDEVQSGQQEMTWRDQLRLGDDESDAGSYDDNESIYEKPLFSRGIAGSQIMYNSSMMKTQGWSMVEEQARYFLNENEKGTMMFYLKEYQDRNIKVDSLVAGLFEILNTHSKFSLLSEIRSFINARDIDRYDTLVMKKEVEAMKARQKGLLEIEKDLLFDSLSSSSHHSSSNSEDSRPITPPFVPEELPPNLALDFVSPPPRQSTPNTRSRPSSRASRHSPESVLNQSHFQTVTADVHQSGSSSSLGRGRSFAGSSLYPDSKSPSEDSGVDMNLGMSGAQIRTSSSLSPHLTVKTQLRGEQSSSSPLSPHSPSRGRLHSKLQRKLSLDSVSTEGSSPSSPHEPMQRLTVGSDQGVPRRISDPTHHVPRDHRKKVAQTKKASEQLLELRRGSNDLASSSPKNSPVDQQQWHSSPDSDDDYDLSRERSPQQNGMVHRVGSEEPKTIFEAIQRKNKQQLFDDLQAMSVDENANERKPSPSNGGASWARRSGGHSPRGHDSSGSDFYQSLGSSESRRSVSPTMSGRSTPGISRDSFTARIQQASASPPPSLQESSRSVEFVDIKMDPPANSRVVEMMKTRPNLGIAVEGGAGTRQPLPKIIKIQPGGSAEVSSDLEVGHVIISVNGRDLRGLNHQQATRIIAEEFKNKRNQRLEFLVVDSNQYKILY